MLKLYTVNTAKEIPSLGGICGPISTPTKMDQNDVIDLIKDGFEIYQHNPADLSEKVLVTLRNVMNVTFTMSRADIALKKAEEKRKKEAANALKVPVTAKQNEESSNTKNQNSNNKQKNDNKVSKPDTFTASN